LQTTNRPSRGPAGKRTNPAEDLQTTNRSSRGPVRS
jgi:hypothetical protein